MKEFKDVTFQAKNNFRQNITIPRSGWKQVRDILDEFCRYEENGSGGYNSFPITDEPSGPTSPAAYYKDPTEGEY